MPRILIVDDHALVREGFAILVSRAADLGECVQAENRRQAEELIAAERFDLAIVDIALERDSGIELIHELRNRDIPVLIHSMYDERVFGRAAIKAGAKGYVSKSAPVEELLTAVRQVLSGRVYLSAELLEQSFGHGAEGECEFTRREIQVLELLGRGMASREIARALGISVKTVATHRENIKAKMGIDSASELTSAATSWVLSGQQQQSS